MTCPNCKNEVEIVDTVDTECFGNFYYDIVEGVCHTCGKLWRWTEVFSFDHVENIEEIEENGHL